MAIVWASALLGAVLFAWVVEFKRRPQMAVANAEPSVQTSSSTEPVADWCAPGYGAIAGGCLAMAPIATRPQPLIVYLHGRYAEDAVSEETDRQRRLASSATARGFAVLALRGRMGECTQAELAKWYCWPSNEHNEDGAPAFVSALAGTLAEAQRRARSATRFVLGFSNGAYFAGLLATRGLLPAEAFVVAHGGPVEPVRAPGEKAPLLLLSADDDIAQDDMMRFDEDLSREHWPHDSYARSGAHGLTDEDIDAALTFFARAYEPIPLEPPLPGLHRPAHHAHPVVTAEPRPVEATPAPAAEGGQPSL